MKHINYFKVSLDPKYDEGRWDRILWNKNTNETELYEIKLITYIDPFNYHFFRASKQLDKSIKI